MQTWLSDYTLFFAKGFTGAFLILLTVLGVVFLITRARSAKREGTLVVKDWNQILRETDLTLKEEICPTAEFKQILKQQKKAAKKKEKARQRVFLIDFDGDIRASSVSTLREVVTAILMEASQQDVVLLRLESGGGMVHTYGLAASQLLRLRDAGIKLMICVDKIAASGGYMMASVAHEIWAAPFAIIGSIGVVAQLPNFHRFLEKHQIDFELHTAGAYKRNLTLFGENTDEGRRKLKDELEETHAFFKAFIHQLRPDLNLDQVATGEHWFGQKALQLGLIDQIGTSDDVLLKFYRQEGTSIHHVHYEQELSMVQKVSKGFANKTAQWMSDLQWSGRLRS